jgi:signal transduction histidine kinase
MKSHEALRGARESANGLTPATDGQSGPGHGPGGQEAAADRAANGGRRRPGSHGQEARSAERAWRRPGWGRRLSFKDWRVRSRLLLLIAVPVLVAVAFGGLAVLSSLRTAESYQQVQRLAVLAGDATNLAQALQNEREDTVTFIAMGNQGGRVSELSANAAQKASAGPELALLNADYHATNLAAAKVSGLAATIGSSYPGLAETQAQGAITAIGDLPALRQAAAGSRLSVLTVINDYGATITQLLTLENEVAAGSKDASLADNVLAATLISDMKEEASEQQAIVTSALRPGLVGATPLSAESLSVLNQQAAEQAANLASFNLTAPASLRQAYNSALSSPLTALAQQQLQQASSLLGSGFSSASDPTLAVAEGDASYVTSSLGSVEQRLMSSIIGQSGSLRDSATTTAVLEGVGVLLLLVLALILIAVVGQSMVGPLRRLRAGALEVAGVRLPETVRLMAETDGEGVSLDPEPIDVDSADEIGEVARAFDQVHREALRLAANEAALRGNVNAMFVNLSRRSQSLVERQIRLISHLEQGEQDSKRLANLFQMDHLATLMRRNSENLLVLAGQDLARRWNRPVALVDVLRAALSEIEHYERVTLNVQPRISVRAQAVSDVVHLTAELVENATSFSAAESPVTINGRLLSSGGVLLEITDQGVGMAEDEMAHANWRLDNPPTVDVAVSRRMGLFVVARLAARHGIRVRLRPAETGGLVALVWLPDETITTEGSSGVGLPRRGAAGFEPAGGGAGPENGGQFAGEQEISPARTPRFARLLRAEKGTGTGPLPALGTGPLPAVGAGGQPAAEPRSDTGPLPEFGTGPLPAFGTGPQPAFGTGPQPEFGTGPQPAFGTGPQPTSGTGPQPATEPRSDTGSLPPFGTGPQPTAGTGPQPTAGTGPQPTAGTGPQPIAGTGPQPAVEQPATGPQPAAGTGPLFTFGGGDGKPAAEPESDAGRSTDSRRAYLIPGRAAARSPRGVVVPPSEEAEEQNRLPIFEAVESDWFRRVQRVMPTRTGQAAENGDGWSSPGDEGWQAAQVVQAPSSAGVTPAGLPKRVPRANLVPGAAEGTAAGQPAPPAAPVRSAAATRDRLASYQQGIRRGRAAASGSGSDGNTDDTSR